METTRILHIDVKKPTLIEKDKIAHITDEFLFVMDSMRLQDSYNVIIECKSFARNYSTAEAMIFSVSTHFQIFTKNMELFSDPEEKEKCTLLSDMLLTAIAHCRMYQNLESSKFPMNDSGVLGYVSWQEAKEKTVYLYEERV
jgi:hypothetical protein